VLTVWHKTENVRPAAALQLSSPPVPSALAVTTTAQTDAVAPKKSSVGKHRDSQAAQGPSGQSTVARAPTAKVQVQILHHFSTGKASIWLDDELVFEQELQGGTQRRLLFRTVEMNQTTSFPFSAGKHSLQVRVVSPANTYDQIETFDATLAPGSEHVLLINCDKREMQVTLQ